MDSYSTAGHWKKVCSCGKYISQCRCPVNPPEQKTVIEIANGCRKCQNRIIAQLKGVKEDEL